MLSTSGFVDDVMFARNGPWLLGRILKVAELGAKCDVYDCLLVIFNR